MAKFTIYEVWTRAVVVDAKNERAALEQHAIPTIEGLNFCNWHAVPHEPKADERQDERRREA